MAGAKGRIKRETIVTFHREQCNGTATSLTAIIRVMEEITGRPLNPGCKPTREGDIRHWLGSPLAAQQVLGFRNQGSIDEGLPALPS